MVKKLFAIVFFTLLLFFGIKYILQKAYIDELGKGYYIYLSSHQILQSRTTKNIRLMDILKTKHNDRYIIAIRLPMRVFYGDKNCTTFSEQQISYVLIDKQTDHIYETNDYEKLTQKLTKNNVQISFSPEELKQAKRKLKNRRHLYKNRQTLMYLEKYCTEDFKYPIEKF